MSVDPTQLPGLLSLLAVLALLIIFGWVFAVRILRSEAHHAALQSAAIGLLTFGLLLNLFAYLRPGDLATILTLLVMLGSTVLLLPRCRPILRNVRLAEIAITLAALGLFWVSLVSRQNIRYVDEAVNIGLATSMASGNFPPQSIWEPNLPATYHYAFSLITGHLAELLNLDPFLAHELLSGVLAVALVGSIAALLLRLSGTKLLAAMGAIAFVYAAGMLSVYVPIGWPSGADLEALGAAVVEPRSAYVRDPQFPLLILPQRMLAFAAVAVVVDLASRRRFPRSRSQLIAFAAVLGYLALIEESIFAIAAIGFAASGLLLIALRRAPLSDVWRTYAPVAVIALTLAALQGGVISDILLRTAGTTGQAGVSLGGLASPRSLLSLDRSALSPAITGFFLGSSIVGVAVGLLAAVRDWRAPLLLATAGLAGTVLFATFEYTYSGDARRFVDYAALLTILAVLATIGRAIRSFGAPTRNGIAGLMLIAVVWPSAGSALLSYGELLGRPLELSAPRAGRTTGSTDRTRFSHQIRTSAEAFRFIRAQTPSKSRFVSTRGAALALITGRFTPSAATGVLQYEEYAGPAYIDALQTLDPVAIETLRVDFIHVASEDLADLDPAAAARLAGDLQLPLVFNDGESRADGHWDRIYAVASPVTTAAAPVGSYRELAERVPSGAGVWLADNLPDLARNPIAYALADARLLGRPLVLGHQRTSLDTERFGDAVPDYVALPRRYLPSSLTALIQERVWTGHGASVYRLSAGRLEVRVWMVHQGNPLPLEALRNPDRLTVVGRPGQRLRLIGEVPDEFQLPPSGHVGELTVLATDRIEHAEAAGPFAVCVGACGTGSQGSAEAGPLVIIRGEVSSANTIEAQIQYFGRRGWPAPGGARWVLLEATSPYYVPVRAHNLRSTQSWVSSITPSFEDYFTRISFNPQTGVLSELLPGNPDVVPRGTAAQIPAGRFVFGLAIGPDRDMLLLPLAGVDVQTGGAVSITAFSGVFEFPALPLGEPREPGLVR